VFSALPVTAHRLSNYSWRWWSWIFSFYGFGTFPPNTKGSSGSNSIFSSITSTGGGEVVEDLIHNQDYLVVLEEVQLIVVVQVVQEIHLLLVLLKEIMVEQILLQLQVQHQVMQVLVVVATAASNP
jgi:hypothetical protein